MFYNLQNSLEMCHFWPAFLKYMPIQLDRSLLSGVLTVNHTCQSGIHSLTIEELQPQHCHGYMKSRRTKYYTSFVFIHLWSMFDKSSTTGHVHKRQWVLTRLHGKKKKKKNSQSIQHWSEQINHFSPKHSINMAHKGSVELPEHRQRERENNKSVNA